MNEQERSVIGQFIEDSRKLTDDQKIVWQNLLNRMMNPTGLNEVLDSLDSENQELTLKFASALQGENGLLSHVDDELVALELNKILKLRQTQQIYDASMQQNVQKVKQGIEDYQKNREESVQQEINLDPGALKNNIKYQQGRVSVRAQLQLLLDKYSVLMAKYSNNNTMKQLKKSVEDYIALGERWGDSIRYGEGGERITELTQFREGYREEIIKKTGEEQILLRDMLNWSNQFLEERTNAQFDVEDTDFDDISAWAAAEEFNQVIAPLNNGYLNLNHPYPYALKDKNDNEIFPEVEPIRVQCIGNNAVNCTREFSDGRKVRIGTKSANSRMLFTHEPSPMDVIQKSLGDCYMLAGLASVAEKYPEKIKESMVEHTIMVQDEFGHKYPKDVVTVRFFKKEVDQKNGKLLGYTPVLVTVDKIVPNNYGNTAALWVQMIERAYAASGLHLDPSRTGGPLQGNVDLEKVRAEYEKPGFTRYDKAVLIAENPQAFRFAAMGYYTIRDSETPDLVEIEGGAGDVFLEQFLGPEGECVKSDFKEYADKISEQKVSEFIKANKNNVITAGTNVEVYDDYGNNPKTIGEDQFGLLAKHEYSILGVEERTFYIDNDPTQPVTQEVVVLRNPMGVSGRTNSYEKTFKVLKAKEQVNSEGVFEISLKDFCKNFNSLRANKITEFSKVGQPSKAEDPAPRIGNYNFTKQSQLIYLKQFRYFADSLNKADKKLKDEFKPLLNTVSDLMFRFLHYNGRGMQDFLKDQKDNIKTINEKCDKFSKMDNPEINKFASKFKGLMGLCWALQSRYMNPMEYLSTMNMDHDKTVNVEVKPQDTIREKLQTEQVYKYDSYQAELEAQPQNVSFTKADYIKALKDVYAGLLRSDEGYSDFKNSSEYKKMRKGLDTFIKNLEKAGDETSIADLFSSNKGLELKNKCKDYLKHSFDKVRNNERRNTRLDEALTAMSLLTAMSKNAAVLAGVKDCMKLAYAEKAMREKMYSFLDSDDKIMQTKGENLRKVMAGRKTGEFTNQLSALFDSPEINKALLGTSFEEMHNNLKTGANGLFANIAEIEAKGEVFKASAARLIQ